MDGQGAYIALVPPPDATPAVTLARGPEAVAAELTPVLADLYERRSDVLAALERAQRRATATRAGELVKETFGRLTP